MTSHEHALELSDVATPAWIVDIDRLINNCERMKERAAALGVQLRPHIKTHKTIATLVFQHLGRAGLPFVNISDGSINLDSLLQSSVAAPLLPFRCCVSTLGEAEFFLQSGLPLDLCIAVPCGSDSLKMKKIRQLHDRYCTTPSHLSTHHHSRLRLIVDSTEALQFLVADAKSSDDGHGWDVFVNIDMGYHREGLCPEDLETWSFIEQLVAARPSIQLIGLYTHAGNSYGSSSGDNASDFARTERDVIVAFAERIRSTFDLPRSFEVGVGSTPTCSNPPSDRLDGITECHPGNYCFFDLHQAAIGSCTTDDIAGSVLTTIVSRYPTRRRLLIDAGALAFSKDPGAAHLPAGCPTRGWGVSPDHPSLKVFSISQEMGVVGSVDEEVQPLDFDHPQLRLGSRLRFFTHHSCLTAACFPQVHVVSGSGDLASLQLRGVWQCAPRQW